MLSAINCEVKPNYIKRTYNIGMDTISKRLRAAMKQAELSASELAGKTGVSRAAVSQWLNGDIAKLKAENIFTAAKVLRLNAEWLATGKGEMDVIYGADLKIDSVLKLMQDMPEYKKDQVVKIVGTLAE